MTDEKKLTESYEREHLRATQLAERVAMLEEENDDLREKVNRIKSNPLWKLALPVRALYRKSAHTLQRVRRQGSIGGVLRKLRAKRTEVKARAYLGTGSFPDAETRSAQEARVFRKDIRFSILTPLYNTPERFLRDMIESVLRQTYANWQLCLADASDEVHAYVGQIVEAYRKQDLETHPEGRIVYEKLAENKGISGNTNACLKMAGGNYIGLLDHDDILHPEVLYLYADRIEEEDADYLYSDETTFSGNTIDHMLTMHFKPDFAPDNLRANNYICHFSVFRKDLMDGDDLFRTKFDGSQDHDMILRLTDRARRIVHIPQILYYWRSHEGSTAAGIKAKTYAIEAARGAVADHLLRHGFRNFHITSTRAFETIFKISYEIEGDPKISIVIPNRDHTEDLKRCIDSIFERSTYANFDVTIVENGSSEETLSFYDRLCEGPFGDRIRIADYTGVMGKKDFNFSAIVNYGVSQTDGEYVLLLNNDTEVVSANWMEELLMYAQRKDVGAVGAKLLFPDGTVQHAGVILGLGAHRTAGHSHYGMSKENLGYMGRLCYAQNMSAVTGACMMCRREVFEEMKGFDEAFVISLNDVDFCLRLREKGYLNVFTPFAVLTHYESKSRGLDDEGERAKRYERESDLFRIRWKSVLERGDPYYNPNFTLDKSDYSLKGGEQ
ncbi:MAG: glycosyltransferase family 2 protein [Lachnospiraceae bacterium]|nr:glycosyltransferase family 2 protein [Lachnospiraceae bacterium]